MLPHSQASNIFTWMFRVFQRVTTVAWRGSLLIFSFMNFFVLGESLVHMETLFKDFEGEKSILGPKITLESLGFEPETSNSVESQFSYMCHCVPAV